MLVKYIILLLVLVSTTSSQIMDSSTCQCNQPNSEAEWAESDEDFCSGCDRIVHRKCRLCDGSITMCQINLSCQVPGCQGQWISWSNTEACQNPCGAGVQRQNRVCYKSGFVRSRRCKGGFGKSEETRLNSCRSTRGCIEGIISESTSTVGTTTTRNTCSNPTSNNIAITPARKTTTSSTTTKATTTKATTTIATATTSTAKTSTATTSTAATLTATTSTARSTAASTTTTTSLPPTTKSTVNQEPEQSSNLILPLVLGSVGVVMLAAIVMVLIICSFKIRSKKNTITSRPSLKEDSNRTDKGMSHIYEEVGFSLPPRNSSQKKHVSVTHSESRSSSNALYSNIENEEIPSYKAPKPNTNVENQNVYLQPNAVESKPISTSPYLELATEESYVSFDQAATGGLA